MPAIGRPESSEDCSQGKHNFQIAKIGIDKKDKIFLQTPAMASCGLCAEWPIDVAGTGAKAAGGHGNPGCALCVQQGRGHILQKCVFGWSRAPSRG